MNDDMKSLLEANYNLTKENNELLHKVRGVQKKAFFLTVIRWIVVVGVALGAYYYIQPYIEKAIGVYNSVPNFGNVDIDGVNSLIKTITSQLPK